MEEGSALHKHVTLMRLILKLLALDGTLPLNLVLLIVCSSMMMLFGSMFLNALVLINILLVFGFVRLSYSNHSFYFKMHNVKKPQFVVTKTALLFIILLIENSLILMV